MNLEPGLGGEVDERVVQDLVAIGTLDNCQI